MKFFSFYAKYFQNIKGIPQQNVICPFHDDKNPSLSLDLESGKWYCHACVKGGDVFQFYMDYNKVSFSKAKNAILGNEQVEILSLAEVYEANNTLINSENILKALKIKRGWDKEIIEKFTLGWSNDRVTIPIYDENKDLVNIRKYDLFHKSKLKFLNVKGYGEIKLFPIENLKKELVILFAGEPDTILANQIGLPGLTFTGGEGTYNRKYLPQFKDKIVYICYDLDEVGERAAKGIAENLITYAKSVHIIHLPNVFPKDLTNADFTDLFIYSIEKNISFEKVWNPIIESAELIKKIYQKEIEYEQSTFFDAIKEENFNKDLKFKAHVIGKGFSPFAAPIKVNLSCNFESGENCKGCVCFYAGGKKEIFIEIEDSLDLINCSNVDQRKKIKALFGISNRCGYFKIEQEIQSIEEIVISPEIDINSMEQKFEVRKAYSASHELQANKVYSFYGKTISDPRTQHITHVFKKQEPELASLYSFSLTEEQKISLEIFQPLRENSLQAITNKLSSMYTDFTFNIEGEKIIHREDLMLCYDLVFFSVLSFYFLDAIVQKGWTECLILGDERTGKTKVAQKMLKHYGAGDYKTLEGASLPGLIGGISQISDEKFFGWGILPLNDGHLVVLDEGNSLDIDGWSNLSSIRDTGIAERNIVGSTRRTLARVRLIILSNPRSYGKKIEHYTSGIEAIKDLIGKNEDIARFDFAMIVTQKDIDLRTLNREESYHHTMEHIYTSELNKLLVQWAWSRKPNNIKFTNDAKNEILRTAEEMGMKYTDTIPLVQRSVQRIKIAKLSVALACRLFSTLDGINVIVKKEHVQTIINFLYKVYDSPFFGYDNFTIFSSKDQNIESKDKVKEEIFLLTNPQKFVEKVLASKEILFEDLMDYTGYSRDRTKEFRKFLVENNCIKRIKSWYVKNPEFISLLKRIEHNYRKGE